MQHNEVWKQRNTEQMNHAPSYNLWVRSSWHPIWLSNAARSYNYVERIFKDRNADVSVLPQKQEPCLIIGSGPSLDDWRPYIKQWKYDIMCSTSQLAWLESAGVNPRYVFLIDADPTMNYLITDYKRVPGLPRPEMITHPCLQREAMEAWNDDEHLYFFRMLDPGDEFFTKFLPMMYQTCPIPPMPDRRGVRTFIMNSGNVVNTMLVFASQKQYSPIVLAGYDLGYPGGQYRFVDYARDGDGWKAKPKMLMPQDRPFKPSHNGVPADELCLFYKYSTLIMYGMAASNLLTSSRGIVDEMPYVSPEDAIAEKWPMLRTPWEAYKVAQEYLRYRKTIIVRTGFSVSVKNMVDMKPWERLRTMLAYWYWRNRSDWEEQAKWYGKKAAKKQAKQKKKAERRQKKQPYDLSPQPSVPAPVGDNLKPTVTA